MEDKNLDQSQDIDFGKLLERDEIKIPQVGDIIKSKVITASKSEVKLDVNGVLIGIVRGPELYNEVSTYADLKPGDEIEAAVIDEENERGELELSFRLVGQEKAWKELREAFKNKEIIKVKIADANKGGLLARYCQIEGFLPVSQLAPENYPRIAGGDKSRILEKLKSFVGQEVDVSVITLNEEDNKIIFSEKDVWNKKQKPALDKYKEGMKVDGKITAITNFGVFVSFGEGIEGLIHISELAWQRIDSPNEMYKVGDDIKAEIISIDGAKVFLSAKKLMRDPWLEASAKYKSGQVVKGTILKVNPFGLFVKLDEEIHGLAHISQLNLGPKEKISELFTADEEKEFEIVSISPSEHRLGLKLANGKKTSKVKKDKEEKEEKEEKEVLEDEPKKEEKEKKKKTTNKEKVEK
ncbi:MAG: S1 RNA-binding domain-containing protein [Patescibacteria group bacterium]|nr:S1 RNA-binding domain-containing protein [Patescibacteria group bacterium]MDD3777983.1 S1 RNA-binding domain-containing protein [Patescibacteria group bacterium]MDD3939197.1 S1 RNA-binding domain-containing protein [Patescibacteria group bacterium]NCU39597.1 S1 RNA-binding domain-containing protein [Candidatus Falkowbacteria bacterium]